MGALALLSLNPLGFSTEDEDEDEGVGFCFGFWLTKFGLPPLAPDSALNLSYILISDHPRRVKTKLIIDNYIEGFKLDENAIKPFCIRV